VPSGTKLVFQIDMAGCSRFDHDSHFFICTVHGYYICIHIGGKNKNEHVNLLYKTQSYRPFNPLNAELNPICHLLALLGGETIVDVSGLIGLSTFHLLNILIIISTTQCFAYVQMKSF
jgi:hypothetical protein